MTARSPSHAAPVRPSIFRRALRMPWRKPAAAPAPLLGAGAATPAGARFACCPHCEGRCARPHNHPVACSDGCNAPVLGDRMIHDVRREWNGQLAHADAMHAASAPYLPAARPVNGRNLGTQPRRQRPGKQPWDTMAHPVYGELPQFAVQAAERLAAERDAARAAVACCEPVSLDLLREVLAGLRKL